MSKTLLATIQSVASVLGLPEPSAGISSNNQQARQLCALALESGIELMQDVQWPHLRKLCTLTMVNTVTTYTVSASGTGGATYSCDRIIDETGYDVTGQWAFVGNIGDQVWNEYLYGIGLAPLRKIFRTTSVNQVEVLPVPTATADSLVLSFITDMWVLSTSGTPQTSFLKDTDTHTFDDTLFELGIRWKFLRANGLSYDEEQDRYEKRLALRKGQVRPARTLSLARRPRAIHLLNYGNVPETGFGT